MKRGVFFIVSLVMVALLLSPSAWAAKEIRLGFNIPLTGDNPDVGGSSRNAAEMYLKDNPTVTVGGKTYKLKFVYEDNEYIPNLLSKSTPSSSPKKRFWASSGLSRPARQYLQARWPTTTPPP